MNTIKIPDDCAGKTDILVLKFIWKFKELRVAKPH